MNERPDIAHYARILANGDLRHQLSSERLRRATIASGEWPSVIDLPRLFRLQIDTAAFVEEATAFVVAPSPARQDHPVIGELSDLAPDVLPTLEAMLLDGVDQPHHVADYLLATLGPTSEW